MINCLNCLLQLCFNVGFNSDLRRCTLDILTLPPHPTHQFMRDRWYQAHEGYNWAGAYTRPLVSSI